ncbi:MAG: aminodeoxychorismate synthase component I [Ferrimonas sp.]
MNLPRSLCSRTVDLPADPIAIFSHFSAMPWAMLLDSAINNEETNIHPDAHYSLIVAQPLATAVCQGLQTTVQEGEHRYQTTADPLTVVQQLQQQHLGSQLTSQSLPFCGGTMGHFSYDLGRRFETLPTLAEDDIKLAEMAVGIYDWALCIDHRLQQVHLLVLGDHNAWQARWHWVQQQITTRQDQSASFALTGPWQHQIDRAHYQRQFDQVQAYLRSGDCYQINLTQRFDAPYEGDEWQAYSRLRAANNAPFSAFIRLPDCALLSFSPERFLQLKQNQISTKPIKGTRPRSHDPIVDKANATALQQAPKDQAENVMIVDLLRNDLGRVATPGSVRVPELFAIESFPAVHHLVSTVNATLAPEYQPLDLLRACFPGGSITGAPKIRAMEIIEQLEPQRRSLYCGSIGYLSQDGQLDTSITIRSLVAKQQRIYCWAGGGIVADSQVDEEYQEIFDKLSRILPNLAP